jgi:AraC-like DNA-binding protein
MNLTPNVLECMHVVVESSKEGKRKVVNYEFDLYLNENRKIKIDGVDYTNTQRTLIFRKPGQITSGIGNYDMFVLTLDFSGTAKNEHNIFRPESGIIQPLSDFKELNDIPTVFPPYHFDELRDLLTKLSEYSYPNAVDKEKQDQYIKEFLLLVLYDSAKFNRANNDAYTSNNHVRKACEYVAKNFRRSLTVKEVAKNINLTENHLIKLFKKELKQTPNQYILELKLIHARYQILQSDKTIQEIAYSCGFNTPSYFTKQFYRQFKILPNELRKR